MRFSGPARREEKGYALMVVLGFTGVSLIMLGGVVSWTSFNGSTNRRASHHQNAMLAAEAATEKVLANVVRDFQSDGEGLVYANLATYRTAVPTGTDDPFWNDWRFSDGHGSAAHTWVDRMGTTAWTSLPSQYAGLFGNATPYQVLSNARHTSLLTDVIAGVQQDFTLANIPVFQFAIFYGVDMEISCGQPFRVTGRVHANKGLWVLPDSSLTFMKDVTAVGDITFNRMPFDHRYPDPPHGTVTYTGRHDAKAPALSMPIGTNNSPDAVHAILEVPPGAESASSPMGRQRYYNKADLIVVVSNGTYMATSGQADGFSHTIPYSQVKDFVKTNATFKDDREGKTVYPVDIDVGALRNWSITNTSIRGVINRDVRSVYVTDQRTLNSASRMTAVRVVNGRTLPDLGLTVATERPFYVKGHYNCPDNAALGTTNTTASKPASLIGDSITILSQNWNDASSTTGNKGDRGAAPTTVNAAFLAGIVESTTYNNYSGGAENFPRFLESWGGSNILTYNGSMVVMFPSRYAVGLWTGSYYDPPARNWAFDLNFLDPTKLPPGTPDVRALIRGSWARVAPGAFGS